MIGPRSDWSRRYSVFPSLPCSGCGRGHLQLDESTRQASRPDWVSREEDIEVMDFERFVMLANCSYPQCREVFCVSGNAVATKNLIVDVTGDTEPETYREITGIHPAPPMIRTPDATPWHIQHELQGAYAAYWIDAEGCVAKLRRSVEAMMDVAGIPRSDANGDFMSLNKRLKQFSHARLNNDWLKAMKHVGNLATHGQVGDEELFDAMDMWEIVLDQAYGSDPKARADQLAKKLNPLNI